MGTNPAKAKAAMAVRQVIDCFVFGAFGSALSLSMMAP
jgi:hypothetical protein